MSDKLPVVAWIEHNVNNRYANLSFVEIIPSTSDDADGYRCEPLIKLSAAENIIAEKSALIEEQILTITALNIALGGEDSTSTENLIDAYKHDKESVGLCFKYRAAKDKTLMQSERIKELETKLKSQSYLLNLARESLEKLLELWDMTRESGALPMDYVRAARAKAVIDATIQDDKK